MVSRRVNSATSSTVAYPSISTVLSSGYALSGCGAYVNWTGNGSLLWRIQPLGSGCAAASKEHIQSSPASINGYSIGLRAF